MKRILAASLAVLGLLPLARAEENEWFVPLGRPPKAAPKHISAGEAMPPLPLPATPLRRSERKRDPKPPTLVGKVAWGETAAYTYDTGTKAEIADWNLCPADLQQLLGKSGRWFGLSYANDAVNLTSFHGDPERMAVLLFNGGRSLKMDAGQIEALRSYILRGGMALFDSIAGSPYFYESSCKLLQQMFPELALRQIPPDHPVYHMLYDIDRVHYPRNLDSDRPLLEGIYVGCRLGAIVSKYGLGCGWDDHEVPLIQKAVYYDVESANRIGLNVVAYAVGYNTVGIDEAKPEIFGSLDEKHPTDEFVFAQIRHEGSWNVHPGGAAALLRRLRANTSLRVSLKRVAVTPGRDDLSSFPFLYLTGLDEFRFDDKALQALRTFLARGGTLVVNNGLGLSTFDAAVRRELKRLLPEATVSPVPADHPVFNTVFPVSDVRYAPAVVKTNPALTAPALEGITLNGDLRVIYSPYDMECAWQGCEHPLARALEPHSGMELGVNLVMYAMTH